jgi:hypothetical protein
MNEPPPLEEGWYLMSVADLEVELRRLRRPDTTEPSGAQRLSQTDALAYRAAGNLPDERGRTLRLVLALDPRSGAPALDARRRRYEPDYDDPPTWRRDGSIPINVVPLPRSKHPRHAVRAWYDDREVGALEREWQATGAVGGLRIPADVRGFVLKTILSLRAAGKVVDIESITGSVSRWVSPEDVEWIRSSLEAANSGT